MKITVHIPDKALPELERLMAETGAPDIGSLFHRAVTLYVYLFRLTRQGLCLALLNRELEIEGRLIDRQLFGELFRDSSGDSVPPQN